MVDRDVPTSPDRFEAGGAVCTVLHDADAPVPAGALFPELDEADVRARSGVGPDELLPGVISALLVERDRHLVLVDAGLGPARGGGVHATLAELGVSRETIDVVVISHGHGDHVGGLLLGDGDPAFPNARHVVHGAESRFWLDAAWEGGERGPFRLPAHVAETARRVLPALDAAGLLDVVESEAEVAPGVLALAAPGHTPGHLAAIVHDGDDALLWAADAFVHPANVADPWPASRMDTDRELTVSTRRALLDRTVERRALFAATHFRARGRVVRTPDGHRLLTEPSSPGRTLSDRSG